MKKLISYFSRTDATAGVEAALLFPVLVLMMLGTFDVGQAITANHKMITATQVVADLVSRNVVATAEDVNQAIEAGTLAMNPYISSSNNLKIDIYSVKYDSSGNPTVLWSKITSGLSSSSQTAVQADVVGASKGLGTANEGAMIVTLMYDYVPSFGTSIIPAYRMRETAYARGRRSSVVGYQ